ncbi:uncharacterized protein LOC123536379 [Mercenaria mercenaria]|uniref:uncharacterized protein LOC123536379 n=1 Tax=Mercenaria mercenaria TaxID=6596 RepID=UPI001E1DD689|nr:uncharacterized protein LOC123536379 [Mercenaria mercenaria]
MNKDQKWTKNSLTIFNYLEKMTFSKQCVLLYVISIYLCAEIVESESYACNDNEFLHVETRKCTVCNVCDNELGLVTWVPCTNKSNTVCGPKWKLRVPANSVTKSETTRNNVFQHVERSAKVEKWKTVENIVTGVLIGVGFTAVLVIVTVCVLHARRRRQSPYRIIYRDEKSLKEIVNERNGVKRNGNIYVKTEDILTSTYPVKSPV